MALKKICVLSIEYSVYIPSAVDEMVLFELFLNCLFENSDSVSLLVKRLAF